MKKALSLILVFVLCLSLCACGTNQDYTEQLEEYEKRIEELEELLAMRDEEINRLLNELESTPSENAVPDDTDTDNTDSGNTQVQYTEIALTVDNWDTYFEVVAYPTYKQNAFGEYDDFKLEYVFQLKDEYYPLLDSTQTNVVMELSYTYGERVCNVDFENQTYELGERLRAAQSSQITDLFYNSGSIYYCMPFGVMVYSNSEVRYYEDVEMIRIQGTLYLQVV